MNKYVRNRRSNRSCLKISDSLYNIFEVSAKDQITNQTRVVANKDRKMKRKQAKIAGKINHSWSQTNTFNPFLQKKIKFYFDEK